MIIPFEVLTDLFNATIAGLPTLVIVAIPFIIGLIGGYLIKKVLKWFIIIGIIIIIIAFFGFFGFSLGDLANMAVTYGPIIYTYGVLLLGVLPLGVGFIVGFVIGFLLG